MLVLLSRRGVAFKPAAERLISRMEADITESLGERRSALTRASLKELADLGR